MNKAQMRRSVVKAFKLSSLQPRTGAVDAIVSVLAQEENQVEALDAIIAGVMERVERNELKNGFVDEEVIKDVVLDLSRTDDDLAKTSLVVLGAFDGPRLFFDPLRKTLDLEPKAQRESVLHAGPKSKGNMMKDRFLLVQQRVKRHEWFSAPVITSSKRDYIKLTPINALLGGQGSKYVLGMLTQPQEGKYFLEDLTTQVPLDLSETEVTAGLFTEHSIVVIEGEVINGTLKAHMMGFPPSEPRATSVNAIGHMDFFGTGLTPHQVVQLEALEKRATDAMFVIISDVHLNSQVVLEKLRSIFAGFEKVTPAPVFVLMGNFCEKPMNMASGSVEEARARFKALAELIRDFPDLAESANFVIVPGPADPGAGNTLPRYPLPDTFTEDLRNVVRNLHLTTNPARLRFYSQEVVVYREDILKKMQRHCIIPPQNPADQPNMDVTEHLVKTLLEQGHLCPLPLCARPIHWDFDTSLLLYPLPHAVVLADRTEEYVWRMGGTVAFNPGSFATNSSFMVYRPATKETDFSTV